MSQPGSSSAASPALSITTGPNSTPIPQKIFQKIRKGEYVDLAELLPVRLGGQQESLGSGAKSKRISNILQWVECFNAYTSVVLAQSKRPIGLFLSHCEDWIQYDSNFRKQAAAFSSEKWAEIHPTLWQLAFANAAPRTHYAMCFSLDHTTQTCDEYSGTTPGSDMGKQSGSQAGSSSKESLA